MKDRKSQLRATKNKMVNYFTDPYKVVIFISTIFLLYFIAVPLLEMLKETITLTAKDAKSLSGAYKGQFTLKYWQNGLFGDISKSLFYKPLFNSLTIAICISAIAITLGSVLAWIIQRTDLPYKNFFSFILVVAYMVPSWCKALAWEIIFKNERVGGYPGIVQSVFGLNLPDWISYGFLPIVITLSMHYFVFTFLLMSSALSTIGGDLEEMAEITGASRFTILRRITFPLVLPAMMSSFILTFSKAMGSFGVPAFLGLKVNYYTLSTMIYSTIRNRMMEQAYILSIALILIASITVYINQKAIGKRKGFTTISGKGNRTNVVKLRKWRPWVTGGMFTFVGVAVVMPLLVLLLESVMLKEGVYTLKNFTTHFWIGEGIPSIGDGEPGILRNPAIWSSTWNTLKLIIIASIIATIVGVIIGYVVARGRKSGSGKFVEQLSFTPMLTPSIALGAIYLSMFSTPKLFLPSLYGTFTLLVLVSVVKYLPFAVRSASSSMMQIHDELEEAAELEGASWVKRFMRIIIPLTKSGMVSSFLLIFISGMKELALIVLLVTPKTQTLTSMTYSYNESGYGQYANAVITVIMVIIISVNLIANKLADADISKGMGA